MSDDKAPELPEMSANFSGVTAKAEKRIRNDERHKIAYHLEQNGDTLVNYLSDPRDAVSLIAYLLRLEANRDV